MVPLIEAMADSACVYLIFPYSDGGELFEHVAARPEGLKEDEARRYFRQITLGLRHLKENGLTHGDVSLENVMLSQGRYGRPTEARLIDLEMARKVVVVEEEGGREDLGKEGEGFSGWCDKTEEAVVYTEGGREGGRGRAGHGPRQGQRQKLAGGKPGYVAPEVVSGFITDFLAADVWSLGICLVILLTGRPLYTDPDDVCFHLLAEGRIEEVLDHYKNQFGIQLPSSSSSSSSSSYPSSLSTPTSSYSSTSSSSFFERSDGVWGAAALPLEGGREGEVEELVIWMLQADPRNRPTLEEILLHPWVLQREGGGEEWANKKQQQQQYLDEQQQQQQKPRLWVHQQQEQQQRVLDGRQGGREGGIGGREGGIGVHVSPLSSPFIQVQELYSSSPSFSSPFSFYPFLSPATAANRAATATPGGKKKDRSSLPTTQVPAAAAALTASPSTSTSLLLRAAQQQLQQQQQQQQQWPSSSSSLHPSLQPISCVNTEHEKAMKRLLSGKHHQQQQQQQLQRRRRRLQQEQNEKEQEQEQERHRAAAAAAAAAAVTITVVPPSPILGSPSLWGDNLNSSSSSYSPATTISSSSPPSSSPLASPSSFSSPAKKWNLNITAPPAGSCAAAAAGLSPLLIPSSDGDTINYGFTCRQQYDLHQQQQREQQRKKMINEEEEEEEGMEVVVRASHKDEKEKKYQWSSCSTRSISSKIDHQHQKNMMLLSPRPSSSSPTLMVTPIRADDLSLPPFFPLADPPPSLPSSLPPHELLSSPLSLDPITFLAGQ